MLIQYISYFDFESRSYPFLLWARSLLPLSLKSPRARFFTAIASGVALAFVFASAIIFRQSDSSKAFIYFQF
jgi:hypothetical protein